MWACEFSVFGGSAWKWIETRKEYYLHQFLPEQPDLNLRNSAVVKELDEIMRFWLQKGVAGFRVDAVGFLIESDLNWKGYYDDEPLCDEMFVDDDFDPNSHAGLIHTHTINLEESYDLICHFHDIVKEFSDFPR